MGGEGRVGGGFRFLLDLHNNARISAACARTYRSARKKEEGKREKEREKRLWELRGILNPRAALQFDTISCPLSVTPMGNRRPRPRTVTVELTPAWSAIPFFSSALCPPRAAARYDGDVFIGNFPTWKTWSPRCMAMYEIDWGRNLRARKRNFENKKMFRRAPSEGHLIASCYDCFLIDSEILVTNSKIGEIIYRRDQSSPSR